MPLTYDRIAVAMMAMDDRVWRRHANPLSGWTRIATFPLWFAAIWSWTSIGWWCLVPIGLLSIWIWLNPRVFPECKDDSSWMTQGVLGERIFVKRTETPVPDHHIRDAHSLTALAGLTALGAITGFVLKEFWLALGGWLLTVTFKMWFVDRMVWLYQEMKSATPEYTRFHTFPSPPSGRQG